jgi:hypothetical protein
MSALNDVVHQVESGIAPDRNLEECQRIGKELAIDMTYRLGAEDVDYLAAYGSKTASEFTGLNAVPSPATHDPNWPRNTSREPPSTSSGMSYPAC